ncbi:MAG: hypothetical protein IJ846_04820 [Alphaproteobacteria bacterium]|nr:hypothetical protein [Alphaproteobacteria bacterium]
MSRDNGERRTGRNVRATGRTGERSEQSPWERQNKNTVRKGGFFISDVFDVVELSDQRLCLLLISILLVLLPYYETTKIANFELTQKDKKDK